MNSLTRRQFLSLISDGLSCGCLLGGSAFTSVGMSQNTHVNSASFKKKLSELPHIYSLKEMPRVDVHAHLDSKQDPPEKTLDELTETFIEIMDQSGITVAINLSGTREMVSQLADYDKVWRGRVLLAPRDTDISDGLWWSEEDLKWFKESGCVGTKIWAQNRLGLMEESLVQKVRYQGEVGLPAIGFHVADPPEGKWNTPHYADLIRDAELLIRQAPDTTLIMAHGFWLMNNDTTLDMLATYFDRYPNLHADLCATYQWWDVPEPTYEKLRNFIIQYQDRLLYGSDANVECTQEQYQNSFRILESTDENLAPFFGDESTKNIRGLGLPLEVLNRIYYGNAARLIPRVKESLTDLGYSV